MKACAQKNSRDEWQINGTMERKREMSEKARKAENPGEMEPVEKVALPFDAATG